MSFISIFHFFCICENKGTDYSYILTNNCPSWIRREEIDWLKKYSHDQSLEKECAQLLNIVADLRATSIPVVQ